MTLRVKLEIIPYGDEDKAYEIGRLDIFNKGPATSEKGWDRGGYHEYGVIQLDPKDVGLFEKTLLHRRWLGAWALVFEALEGLEIEGPK